MTTRVNDLLFNAAVAGITAGCLSGKDFDQISAASIANAGGAVQQAAVAAAAAAVDAAIPYDALISVSSTGVMYVVPFAGSGTDTTLIPFFTKPLLLAQLCHAAFQGQAPTSAVQASYNNIAAGIAAQYTATITQMQTS
jgi:hypothetical protein